MLHILDKTLTSYRTETDGNAVSKTAKGIFSEYFEKIFGVKESKNGEFTVAFSSDMTETDRIEIFADDKNISFGGSKRGVIYAVYEFLEKFLGVGFFAPDCEVLPEEDINLEKIDYRYEPAAKYRQYLGNSDGDDVNAMKHKLNGKFWGAHKFTSAQGGGYEFAGVPAHSLTGEFLLKPYRESNPEFFSLVNGKRMTDCSGQVCATNAGALKAVIREVKKLLKENPDKYMVSVSQGDNHNFCQCENCKREIAKNGLSTYYMKFVNEVAKEVKKVNPDVFVHTFAYWDLSDAPAIELSDNIMVQYCNGGCYSHKIDDPDCERNRLTYKGIKEWNKVCKSIMCWDYLNTFTFQLLPLPEFDILKDRYRFMAENNFRGFFAEADHRRGDGWAAFSELRCYLTSALMWNPFMSDEEYYSRLDRFLNAYYGAGGSDIRTVIDIWDKESDGEHIVYGGHPASEKFAPGVNANGNHTVANVIPPERHDRIMKQILSLISMAYEKAKSEEQRSRVERLSACFIWYDLYKTMEKILESGTEEEKRAALSRNARLVDIIKKYKLKLTFWGKSIDMQIDEMERNDYKALPPNKWDYKW